MSDHILDPTRRTSPSAEALSDLPESDVIEVPLLLPGWQMSALERAAHKRGLTAGEMVRHLLRDFFATQPPRPCEVSKARVG
jgi:hypothetical protein